MNNQNDACEHDDGNPYASPREVEEELNDDRSVGLTTWSFFHRAIVFWSIPGVALSVAGLWVIWNFAHEVNYVAVSICVAFIVSFMGIVFKKFWAYGISAGVSLLCAIVLVVTFDPKSDENFFLIPLTVYWFIQFAWNVPNLLSFARRFSKEESEY